MARKAHKTTDQTRAQLIEAGKALFSEKGFDGTTVKEIANAAGVNISLISYHFDGKEKLYRECVGDHGGKLLEMAKRILTHCKSEEEFKIRLRMFIDECFMDFVEDPELSLMAFREAEQMNQQNDPVLHANYIRFFEKIIEFIKVGQSNGIAQTEIDPYISAGVLFGGLSHFIKMNKIRETYFKKSIMEDATRNQAAEHITKIFLEGVLIKA
ncbi:MAG: TetR/AcrR family transcriptional regulator [Bdellovibrionales bacterium]